MRRITRSMRSWVKISLTAIGGKNAGGRAGKMGGAISDLIETTPIALLGWALVEGVWSEIPLCYFNDMHTDGVWANGRCGSST